jgi:hypothetical protein
MTAKPSTKSSDAGFRDAKVWIYADRISHTPARRYITKERTEFAFGDVRRLISGVIAKDGFDTLCIESPKPKKNPLIATIMRLVA